MKKRAADWGYFWRLLANHREMTEQTLVITPDKEYSLCGNSLEKAAKWMAEALNNQQQQNLRQGENQISTYHIIISGFQQKVIQHTQKMGKNGLFLGGSKTAKQQKLSPRGPRFWT